MTPRQAVDIFMQTTEEYANSFPQFVNRKLIDDNRDFFH